MRLGKNIALKQKSEIEFVTVEIRKSYTSTSCRLKLNYFPASVLLKLDKYSPQSPCLTFDREN